MYPQFTDEETEVGSCAKGTLLVTATDLEGLESRGPVSALCCLLKHAEGVNWLERFSFLGDVFSFLWACKVD